MTNLLAGYWLKLWTLFLVCVGEEPRQSTAQHTTPSHTEQISATPSVDEGNDIGSSPKNDDGAGEDIGGSKCWNNWVNYHFFWHQTRHSNAFPSSLLLQRFHCCCHYWHHQEITAKNATTLLWNLTKHHGSNIALNLNLKTNKLSPHFTQDVWCFLIQSNLD